MEVAVDLIKVNYNLMCLSFTNGPKLIYNYILFILIKIFFPKTMTKMKSKMATPKAEARDRIIEMLTIL